MMVNSNSGIVINYFKKMELKLRNYELELRKFELKFPTKKLIQKLIYHFYNVNTYMWCYQYTGTIMIQNLIKMVWIPWAPLPTL